MIRELWEDYLRNVIPNDAPTVQRWECRRAFYAGAQALFLSILRALEPGKEPTEKDLETMDLIQKELIDFEKKVSQGTA